MSVNVNGIGNQTYYGKANGTKPNRRNNDGGFYESLSENMNDRAGAESAKDDAVVSKSTVSKASYQYHSVSSTIALHESGRVSAGAILECGARHISYAESDYVKVFVEEGYTFKAKVDLTGHSIYIEQKNEDGTVKGYEVDYGKLRKDTEEPIEQMALESWEMARRAMAGDTPFFKEIEPKQEVGKKTDETGGEETDSEEKEPDLMNLSIEEAMLWFYDFIQDRIKNGPPKYQIGASELSIKEWDKLLDEVDGQLDAIREELRERIEKMKEQQLEAEADKKQQSESASDKDKDEEKTEEELLASLFQDKNAE